MALDAYKLFVEQQRRKDAYLYDDKQVSSFPTDAPQRGVPSIPSAILGSIYTANRLKEISDRLIAGDPASMFFDLPGAPPPSILYGDNEGIQTRLEPVITPTQVVPPSVTRAPPSVRVRPPVRTWPPPLCC